MQWMSSWSVAIVLGDGRQELARLGALRRRKLLVKSTTVPYRTSVQCHGVPCNRMRSPTSPPPPPPPPSSSPFPSTSSVSFLSFNASM